MNNPKTYIPVLAVLLLLSALGLASSDSAEPHRSAFRPLVPDRGLVTFAEGNVEVRRHDGIWEPLYTADRVRPDDSLRTAGDGRVEVSWGNPRRVLRVERESVVALSGAAVGNRLVLAGARVGKGAVWAKVVGRSRSFSLASEGVLANMVEATLSLRLTPGAERLAVYDGQASVNGENVNAGFGVAVTPRGTAGFDVLLEDDLRDGWRDLVKEALGDSIGSEEIRASTSRSLKKDLRDLSPEIYLGVEVEITGTASADDDFEAESARIRKIRVRSEKWDAMHPDHKVRLLNDTFDVLRERYPTILGTVVLEFDDDRPRLSLKYAAAG